MGRVFFLLGSRSRVFRFFGWAAAFMRAVAGFSQHKNLGVGLWGVSDVEHPGSGCRLRKCGRVGERVGGGGEERGGEGGG